MRSSRPGSVAIALAIVVALAATSVSAQAPQTPPPAPTPAEPPPATPPPDQPPPPGAQPGPGASKVFNPDISVIGNFLGALGKNEMSEQPALDLSEVEVAFQAVVDPYARADFFLSATPEGVEVEEGFITFTTLPAGLLLKAGKMRAQFGKANTMHTHILPWTDRPLVSQNLVGGEEGLVDAGLSLSKLIPNDALFLEATGEVYRGRSEVFQGEQRSDVAFVGRLRGYRDLSDNSNLDMGVSFAHGPTDLGPDIHKRLVGVDVTFRWRPLERAIYRRFIGRTELIWSRRDAPENGTLDLQDRPNAFGMYVSGDYQFARRWYVGARLDRSERAFTPSLSDSGASVSLTFWPTEFSLIRGQYRRTNYAEGVTANELLFQLNFSIGAHGAHVF